MNAQPFLIGTGWIEVRDGDATAETLFSRHYSRRPGVRKKRGLIVGPGGKLLLLWPDAKALFVWRKEQFRRDAQVGVECAVFRNEGAGLSSELIVAAERFAWSRWPAARLFTFVNANRTAGRRSRNSPPGACFIAAGWRPCGMSRSGLHVLEKLPEWGSA